jgi:hypothetical protein
MNWQVEVSSAELRGFAYDTGSNLAPDRNVLGSMMRGYRSFQCSNKFFDELSQRTCPPYEPNCDTANGDHLGAQPLE